MCSGCNERKSSGGLDVSVDDLKRSRSPLGPHRSKLVIICLKPQCRIKKQKNRHRGVVRLAVQTDR